jgi:hypothetical protein
MSQDQNPLINTRCQPEIIRSMKKCAIERGITLQQFAIEAWKYYLDQPQNIELLQRKIVITR